MTAEPVSSALDIARSAEGAVLQAQSALANGQPADAVRWLQRAARLVPDDSTVPLVLASAYAQTDPAKAVTVLQALTARLPWHGEAALALCASLLRAARPEEAADTLGALIARGNPAGFAAFGAVAGSVCAAARRPGWFWLDGSGTCHLRLAGPVRAGSVRLTMDGVLLRTVRIRSGGGAAHRLPAGWQSAQTLVAALGADLLIGSGLAPLQFAQAEGFVAAGPGGTAEGWARLPADGAAKPSVWLQGAAGDRQPIVFEPEPDGTDDRGGRWRFVLAGLHRAEIVDDTGRPLWGSPVLLGGERDAARRATQALAGCATPAAWDDRFRPLPASLLPAPEAKLARTTPARLPPCDVVVPVYGGAAELEACLDSLLATLPRASRVVLVNDGSPDPAITARLRAITNPRMVLVEHGQSRGFPAAVNAGLARLPPAGPGRDVVILNADTLLGPHWLARLSAVAHSDPAIGSVTPLTNDGTIVSYPSPGEGGAMPGAAALAELNRLCWDANGNAAVSIPTGVGFCMLMKGACLAETGYLREDVFAQGYGEENDWCLRAAHLGWRHVAAPGVFVGHSGGRSFGAAKALLMARNGAMLERLHPGYGAYVAAAMAAEPLLPARRRIDRLRLLQSAGPAVALVTHGSGGGVARHVAARCGALAAAGRHPIVLSPADSGRCGLADGMEHLPNLAFGLPAEAADLASVLADAGVDAFEFHHLLDHHPSVAELPARLGVPYDVFIHDYALWCPRITLTSRSQRYCGEPLSVAECEECVADLGSNIGEDIDVAGLRRRSGRFLAGARRIVVPCQDVAGRIRRQFPGVKPDVMAWEPAIASPPPLPRCADADPEVHVVVAGAIGTEKGYDVLLGCARDAARRGLKLRFTVVGHTMDDGRLVITGRAFVTGRFAEGEGLDLVREQRATLGFVPSVCPETWSYSLSMLFGAGLPVMAFGLGAQAERVKQRGRGWLLPLGIPVTKINDALVRSGLETLRLASQTPAERRIDEH